MLIPSIVLTAGYPTGRENIQRFRYLFSASAPNEHPSRFHESDAGVWTHGHGSSPTATYRLLSGDCVVVVVCNYKFAAVLTRAATFSTCTSGFVTDVEARSSPGLFSIKQSLLNDHLDIDLGFRLQSVWPGSMSICIQSC